jgi:hypothetical protein
VERRGEKSTGWDETHKIGRSEDNLLMPLHHDISAQSSHDPQGIVHEEKAFLQRGVLKGGSRSIQATETLRYNHSNCK